MPDARPRVLLLLLVAASTLLTAPLPAATIQTLDGQRLQGDLKLDPAGKLLLTPPGGKPIPLDPANILTADFRAQSTAPSPQQNRAPAPRWVGRDIGAVAKPGASLLSNGNLVVQASGADIGGNADAFHFAYRPLNGDGELVARLLRLDPAERPIKVGLMMRSNIDPASSYAMAMLIPRSGASFQSRPRPGGPSAQKGPGAGAGTLPAFLKLKRDGKRFLAFYSDDGNHWQYLGEDQVDLPRTVLAGVAVSARSGFALATATFDQLQLTGPGVEADKNAANPAHRNARGVLFRDGSFLAGANARITDEATIRLARGNKEHTFTPQQVAAVFFNERTAETADRASKLKTAGALINNGDFIEGSIREADRGRVRVSSVLFGLRQFESWRVAACVYAQAAPTPTRYEVRLNDGSVLYTDAIKVEKDAFAIELKPVGVIAAKLSDVQELNAGAARFQSLTDLRVATVDRPPHLLGEPYALNASLTGRPLSLDGQPLDSALTLAGNVSVSFSLDGAYRSLTTRLAVPDGLLPTTPVTLVLLADGKELHRTAGRTSLDDPVSVTIDLARVQTLTLRVESPTPSLATAGLFATPMLVK